MELARQLIEDNSATGEGQRIKQIISMGEK